MNPRPLPCKPLPMPIGRFRSNVVTSPIPAAWLRKRTLPIYQRFPKLAGCEVALADAFDEGRLLRQLSAMELVAIEQTPRDSQALILQGLCQFSTDIPRCVPQFTCYLNGWFDSRSFSHLRALLWTPFRCQARSLLSTIRPYAAKGKCRKRGTKLLRNFHSAQRAGRITDDKPT